jgi:hypothetical protein
MGLRRRCGVIAASVSKRPIGRKRSTGNSRGTPAAIIGTRTPPWPERTLLCGCLRATRGRAHSVPVKFSPSLPVKFSPAYGHQHAPGNARSCGHFLSSAAGAAWGTLSWEAGGNLQRRGLGVPSRTLERRPRSACRAGHRRRSTTPPSQTPRTQRHRVLALPALLPSIDLSTAPRLHALL